MTTDMLTYQGKAVKEDSVGLFSGKIAADLQPAEDELVLNWGGNKIAPRLWEMIKAFMLWTYEKHHTEGQLRLYYSESKGVWAAHPMPQYIHGGLFTSEIKNSKEADAINAKFGPMDWNYMGTVHHHCSSSAFQSGTDHKDEITKTGLHITLGGLDTDDWSIHARCCLRGLMYATHLEQWLPETDKIKKPVIGFPSHWKQCLIEKPKPPKRSYRRPKQTGFSAYSDDWFNSAQLEEIDAELSGSKPGNASVFSVFGGSSDDAIEAYEQALNTEFGTKSEDFMAFIDEGLGADDRREEDCVELLGQAYDALDQLLDEAIDPEFVVNFALRSAIEAMPDEYCASVSDAGELTLELVEDEDDDDIEPALELVEDEDDDNCRSDKPVFIGKTCVACDGTGWRSGDVKNGVCGICKGLKYIVEDDSGAVVHQS